MSEPNNKDETRQRILDAMAVFQKFWVNSWMTRKGLALRAFNIVVNTLVLWLVIPWFPGIGFHGGLAAAVVSALVIAVLSLVGYPLIQYSLRTAERLVIEGESGTNAFTCFVALLFAWPVIDLLAISIYPGALEVSGVFGCLFAYLGLIVAGAISFKSSEYLGFSD